MDTTKRIMRLQELEVGQMTDCFALLATRDRAKTRDGKPYYRVAFRDSARTATAMIWSDSAWFADCDAKWQVGKFYKLRCKYTESQYGPQLELDRVREVEDADKVDGFDPAEFFESTRFDVEEMFDQLCEIARTQISDVPLRKLTLGLLEVHAEQIRRIPAATHNHHNYVGGFVEHVLSVAQTAVYLADKYTAQYPQLSPPLSKSLVVAGAILHDIGKLIELQAEPPAAGYTAAGHLIGHILLGRDIVRAKAAELGDLDAEMLLRLEHIIVSHQNLPEWGSPKAPSTPEALLVYFADDIDAKFNMMARILGDVTDDEEEFTGTNNVLRRRVFRGLR